MRSIVVLAAAVAALFAAAAPAVASTLPRSEAGVLAVQTFRNQQSGRCLDDSFAYGPRPFGCNNLDFQRWTVINYGSDSRGLRNVNTGRCLAADRTNSVYAAVECGTSMEAVWVVRRWADGTVEFRNQAWGGCLEDTVWLRAANCDQSREQSWY